MLYTLASVEGEQSFDLKSGVAQVIGRALTSDIPVFDPTISRRHAALTTDEAGVEVRDLGSSNGTFVNGAKVSKARLNAGDIIAFGKVSFRIAERAPAPPPGMAGFAGMPTPISSRSVAPAYRSDGRPGGVAPPRDAAKIVHQLRVPESDPQAFEAALRHRPSGARASGARASGALGGGALAGGALASGQDAAGGTTPDAPSDREKNEQKLALLLEVSKGLTRVPDTGALLEKIAGFCLQIFDVDYVSVLLADEHGAQVPAVARDRKGAAPHRSVPQSIVRSAVHDKVAILSDNAPEDVRFGGESILLQRVRSTMCAPLVGGEGQVLGVLYVDNVTSTHRVDEEDLEFLAAFAGIAAVAIEHGQFSERIRHELVVRNNFERYFAPTLAAQIAGSPDSVKLGGDKRPVAVLFSDIRGFTALSRSMTPDDMAALLSEYFTEMVDCVFRHGGTLDKFMGDAVMAQWGAPIANADDPDRAMRAAIDMMHALDALNTQWRAEGRPELAIGIGLSYGEVFAGNIGSERRLEFTVIGDTVNLASRLSSAAEAGEILISEDIRRVLQSPPPLDEHPPLELKGNTTPVAVYRVTTL